MMNTDQILDAIDDLIELALVYGDRRCALLAQAERDVGEYAGAVYTSLWSFPESYRIPEGDRDRFWVLVDKVVEPAFREQARDYFASLTA